MVQFASMTSFVFYFLAHSLYFCYVIKANPVKVRRAVSHMDYLSIISHKHKTLQTGQHQSPDFYYSSIERKMRESKEENFMAFKGDILVGCADLLTIDIGNHYHVQNVIVGSDHRRCGVATSLLQAVGDHITIEKNKLVMEKRTSTFHATVELDVDRSNISAKSLYAKNGYSPKFSWGNLLNHRQKMFKIIEIQPVASTISTVYGSFPSTLEETWQLNLI